MIALLITGRLIKDPCCKTTAKGKPYVTASLAIPVDNEDNVFCNAVAFEKSVVDQLSVLSKGDVVTLSGTGAPRIWEGEGREPKATMSIKAENMLSAYQLRKKRKVTEPSEGDGKPYKRPYQKAATAMQEAGRVAGLVDDLPWEQS